MRKTLYIHAMDMTMMDTNSELNFPAAVKGALVESSKVAEIVIDPQLSQRYDAHDLGSIITEAVNDALGKLAAATSARFAPLLEEARQLTT